MDNIPIPTLLVIFGVLIICFTMYRSTRRRPHESVARSSPTRFDETPVRESLDKLLVEIQEVSRTQIAQLDTKIRLVRQLMTDLDAKQKEIERLLKSTSGPTAAPMPTPKPAKPPNPLHEKVYNEIDSGKSVDEVCAHTGMGRGEVELILGLRKIDHE